MMIVPCAKLNHKTGEDMLQKHIISHPGFLWFVQFNFIVSFLVKLSKQPVYTVKRCPLSHTELRGKKENVLAAKIKGKEGRKSVVQRQEFILKVHMIESVVSTDLSSLVFRADLV